jgi:hypothetical protein
VPAAEAADADGAKAMVIDAVLAISAATSASARFTVCSAPVSAYGRAILRDVCPA